MTADRQADWDPRAEAVLRDQRAAYDAMRETRPVAYSELLGWSVFRHDDVLRVLLDHQSFSNAVSARVSAPNGMDPPEHTAYRRLIEPYFAPEPMQAFSPVCRRIAADLIERSLAAQQVEFMAEVAGPFAVRAQCAFLGWPLALEGPLIDWTRRNRDATLAQDRQELAELASQFEQIIVEQLERRREVGPDADVTAGLMHQQIGARRLNAAELASILRNWTAGEVGTMAAALGILVQFLAAHDQLQSQLRSQPALVPYAIDEILRIDGPLVANRRVTTRPVELRGIPIAAGQRVSLMWISANRDSRVFPDPYEFRWDRDPAQNLLYGAGIHVCPGAPLARLEMRLFIEELLGRTTQLRLNPDAPPTRARFPASGYDGLSVRLQAA
ncbi:MAG: cytochrome P450 [Planctomycetota bacterium]|nr:MAG: cytochrome P450 [Planctomycetota bacterium]